MIRKWPVIDGRVAVFKKDGGPIDEEFTPVGFPCNDVMYKRKSNGCLYAFFWSHGKLGYWGIKEYDTLLMAQKVNGFFLGILLGDPDITILDPHCYIMYGGTFNADD